MQNNFKLILGSLNKNVGLKLENKISNYQNRANFVKLSLHLKILYA